MNDINLSSGTPTAVGKRSHLARIPAAILAAYFPVVAGAQVTNLVYATLGYESGASQLVAFNASAPFTLYQPVDFGTGKLSTDPAISPDGSRVYVPLIMDNSLAVVSATNGTILSTITGLPGVGSLATQVSPDSSRLYLGTFLSFAPGANGQVTVINLQTNSVIANVPVNIEPEASAMSPDGSRYLLTNYGSDTVSIVNTATNTVTGTVSVGTAPRGAAISPEGTKAYIANAGSNSVSVIDLGSNTVTGSITVGLYPRGIAISPDGNRLYVANFDGHSVTIINTSTNSVVTTISLRTSANDNDPGEFPMGISVSPDGSRVFVVSQGCDDVAGCSNPGSNQQSLVTVINASTNSIAGRINVGIAANQVGRFVSANLITGNVQISSQAALEALGFLPAYGNSVNFAGGTLTATGSFALAKPLYLGDSYHLAAQSGNPADDFVTAAGGTIDTNGFDLTISGNISGPGGLTKSGAGNLTLSGAGSWTGATAVNAGSLIVNGSTGTGPMTVGAGATLGGQGTIGGNAAASGTIAPGTSGSMGTLSITGHLVFNAGSTFRVRANESGQSDRLVVSGGTTIGGGTVDVRAASGSWSTGQNYTILTSAGGRTGTFSSVTTDLAFLSPTLTYDANNVYLALSRNTTTHQSVALTPNQAATATVLDRISAGAPSAAMNTILTTLTGYTATQVQDAYKQLSGQTLSGIRQTNIGLSSDFVARIRRELHGRLFLADPDIHQSGYRNLADTSHGVVGDVSNTLTKFFAAQSSSGMSRYITQPSESSVGADGNAWIQGIGMQDAIKADPTNGIAESTANAYGIQIGIDRHISAATTAGISLACLDNKQVYSDNSANINGRATSIGVYASTKVDDWIIGGALGYNTFNEDTSRLVLGSNVKGNHIAHTLTAEGSLAYRMVVEPGYFLLPSLIIETSRYWYGGYSETGASGANLTIHSSSSNSGKSIAGVNLVRSLTDANSLTSAVINVGAAWRHTFAGLDSPTTVNFASDPAGGSFSVAGGRQSRDGLQLEAGAQVLASKQTKWFIDYSSVLTKSSTSHALAAGFVMNW